jgi:Restriction endonuclease BglII
MSDENDTPEEESLEEQAGAIETTPNEAADPPNVVEAKIPADIRARYEILSYRNAAVILTETRSAEIAELWDALRSFTITTRMIRKAGGNESEMPKLFTASLRPKGWHETVISADLVIKLTWREQIGVVKRGKKEGKAVFVKMERETRRDRYLDGHKIDYVKNRVAFDLEWNSKDQTFDRDLYAFNAFFLSGALDAGVLVTRGQSLQTGLAKMGLKKYGASTTWWGKLIYRLNAGRNGGCPVLAVGITPACVSDWPAA